MSELNPHLYPAPDESISPAGLPAQRLLSWLDGNWPVEIRQGQLVMAENFQGFTLAQHLTRQGTPQQGEEAAQRVRDYIATLNRETSDITAHTNVTSHPALVMARPANRRLDEVMAWHLLRARLEASGAQVFEPRIGTPNDYQTWTRDRYTLAPDGTPVFHRILNAQDQEVLGWRAEVGGANRAEKLGEISRTLEQQLPAAGSARPATLQGFIEGGNVLQHPQSNSVFVGVTATPDGHLLPDELRSAQELAARLGMHLVPVALMKNPPFYHLDTMMSALPDGSVIIFPDATSRDSMRAIRHAVPDAYKRLELAEQGPGGWDDRRLLTTNFVTVNGNLFAARTIPEIEQFATAHGLRVLTGPYEFGGSGPHCQVNFLTRNPTPDGRSDLAALELPRVPDARATSPIRNV